MRYEQEGRGPILFICLDGTDEAPRKRVAAASLIDSVRSGQILSSLSSIHWVHLPIKKR